MGTKIPNPNTHSNLQAPSCSPEPASPSQTSPKRGRPNKDYPSLQSPTIGEIQQAALFYEGEGNYYIQKGRVAIGQNDREKLDWLQLRFGGKVYGPYIGSIRNDVYLWVLVRERALGFMFTIFTFLSKSRREQFRTGKREHQPTISDKGISEAYLERKLSSKLNSDIIRRRGKMGLFGVRK